MTTISAGRIVSGSRALEPGWFTVCAGQIAAVGQGAPPTPADRSYPDATIVPGFVDIHVHGGGGAGYTDGIADEIGAAAAFHRSHGTTTTLASLVSASPDALVRQVRALRDEVAAGTIAGIHLEGPWLSPARCGAHDPATLRDPDPYEIEALLHIGGGAIRMITVAPELDGGLDAVRQIVDAGAVAAVGHTEATYGRTCAAIDAGARVGTHLFNAMRPLGHREPGPVLALLSDDRTVVELIGDGVHVHPDLAAYVQRIAGPGRVALVTDAMAAAGMPDGAYRLGAVDVDVRDGVARVRASGAIESGVIETGAIAGSTATMDVLFHRAALGLSGDGPITTDALVAAVEMCSRTPARAVGLTGVGDLAPGFAADYLVIDADARLVKVVGAGA
ncbi:N-acetylglucosamine-6-phosphate deacetylase [Gordonia sp. DT30]|uniref:N-acetylglucosamine-6-phosphate deacetylase n=1 Tax=Gordonia sp. DT30 TaxID=3416546 RepID=UPI003CF81D01